MFTKSKLIAGALGAAAVALVSAPAMAQVKWVTGAVPPNAFVANTINGVPLHVCHIHVPNKESHVGKEYKGNCYVEFGGKELKAPLRAAQVLALGGPTGWTPMSGGKLPPNAIRVGTANGGPMHVCRTMAPDHQLHPGKEIKGHCYIGYGGKGIRSAAFEVLTAAPAGKPAAAPATRPAPASAPAPAPAPTASGRFPVKWASVPAAPPTAFVANTINGVPVHVCHLRMPNKEVHVGKEFRGNCYVEFGGKEVRAPLRAAQILILGGPAGWTRTGDGKVPPNAIQVGATGHGPMFVCRTMAPDRQLHPGKVERGSCYIGYGGKGIKSAKFEILTAGK